MKGARDSRFKRKRSRQRKAFDLEGKVAAAGGEECFGLEAPSSDDDDGQRMGNGGTNGSVDGGSNTRQFRQFRAVGESSHGGSQGQRANGASSAGSIRNPYAMRRARRSRSSTGATNTTRSDASLPRAAVHIVCAVGENLARETCVASLNAGSPVALQITKQANGQTYAETLAYLEILNPDEVLLNEGRQNSQLAAKVLQLFGGSQNVDGVTMSATVDHHKRASGREECKTSTVVKFISRSCFDQTRGAELLRRVTRDDSYDASLIEDYTVVSSAHAVLHYTQQCLGASISRKCLQVIFDSGGNNQMAIDRSTLLQLELLANAKTGKTRSSLMATIDCTKTTVGSRLLRTNLMAPPCRADTINARLDLVDTILADEDFFYTVLDHLKSLPDVDKMLATVAIVPQARRLKVEDPGDKPAVSVRMASKGISALVCIKTTLTLIPAFATALSEQLGTLEPNDDISDNNSGFRPTPEDSSLLVGLGNGPRSQTALQHQHLMSAIIKAMKNPALGEVFEAVSDIFVESTNFSRSPNAMRHQECFALKSADDGLLDILRKAFLSNVDDIYKKADEYAETYKIRVNVRYAASRGYYLSLPGETASTLPQIFIQPAKRANSINCTTEEVQSLNSRAQDNVNDLLLMTTERIKEVLDFARSNYDALASLSDAVALLDLCHSFADNVTLSKLPWCRPVITDGPDSLGESNRNTIVIRQGRYGIDVVDACPTSDGPGAFVPNDTYASEQKSFTLLSGANGSGKSTYLKQIAIIVVLAHCGSYVPAEHASIPVRNRLSARIGIADDQESNISSFMLEMKETAVICRNAGPKSLILFDELGRATSNEDGIAIAWSVSEYLISKHAMSFFVTHYPQLCRLSNIYPTAQNQHLEATISGDENSEIRYTHKVTPGPCTVASDYGVHMAFSCGWPADVSESARATESDIRARLPESGVCDSPSTDPAEADTRSLISLSANLVRLVGSETSINLLRKKLTDLRASYETVPLPGRIEELLKDSERSIDAVDAPSFRRENDRDDINTSAPKPAQDSRARDASPSANRNHAPDRDDDEMDAEYRDGNITSSDTASSNSSGASSLSSIDNEQRGQE